MRRGVIFSDSLSEISGFSEITFKLRRYPFAMLDHAGSLLTRRNWTAPGWPPPQTARGRLSAVNDMDERVTPRSRGLLHWLRLTGGGPAGQGRLMSGPSPIVTVGSVRFGNALPLALIAGPCALESRQHALEMASALKEIAGAPGLASSTRPRSTRRTAPAPRVRAAWA